MKPAESKAGKSSAITALVATVLVAMAGLSWMALRGGSSATPAQPAARVEHPAEAIHPQEASTTPRAAPTLPTRQWKVGDSFVYQIDSTRQILTGTSPATPE